MGAKTVRVAAVQFSIGADLDENLATVLRMIDTAAAERPQVMVLPEFCNHLSIYDSAEHAWEVAVDLDGPWVAAVAERAARHGVWLQANATVRRSPTRITNTNLVFAPDGQLSAANDKTVLMGAEGIFLSPAESASTLLDTPFGLVGTYACMDGVVPEVPRSVAVRGARLLLNSLNSFALDEARLHIPVRAAENRAFVVAACKVGPLLPADKVAEFSVAMGVPGELLRGAGESQIVGPDGSTIAIGPRDGEAVVIADVDLALSGLRRPDGTDVLAARRPHVYAPLAAPTPPPDEHRRADVVTVAAAVTLDGARRAMAVGACVVVLPELAVTIDELDSLAALAGLAGQSGAVVATSVRDRGEHVGVLVSADGVVLRQPQLHAVARHPWSQVFGASVEIHDLEWGRVAIVVGDDLVYPEVARLAALQSVDVLLVPFDAQEDWETRLGLVERAAENRMCVVASTHPGPSGSSMIVSLPPDFTLWAPSRERVFDGTINEPDVTRAEPHDEVIIGAVHPARSVNRQISRNTNLVDGRPWALCSALVAAQE